MGLRLKKCGAGMGWDGLQVGVGAGVGAGKISQTHVGAERV